MKKPLFYPANKKGQKNYFSIVQHLIKKKKKLIPNGKMLVLLHPYYINNAKKFNRTTDERKKTKPDLSVTQSDRGGL